MENIQKVYVAQTLGMLGGVYFAHKKNSGAWGYIGYGFLFSFVAGRVARMFFPVNYMQVLFPPSQTNQNTGVVPPATDTTGQNV